MAAAPGGAPGRAVARFFLQPCPLAPSSAKASRWGCGSLEVKVSLVFPWLPPWRVSVGGGQLVLPLHLCNPRARCGAQCLRLWRKPHGFVSFSSWMLWSIMVIHRLCEILSLILWY